MFVLAKEMAWVWPVKVTYPTNDGFKDGEFRARFRLLPAARRAELEAAVDPITAVMSEAVLELLDLEDDAGVRLEHSLELLASVLDIPFMRLALWHAYIDSVTVNPRKNS